jgi:predicted O-methyltransferase YrrM
MDPGSIEWTEWSMAPEDLNAVTNLIAARRPGFVVELGAGWSTLVLARAVADVGGALTSIEHDVAWAANVRESVLEAGLRDVRVIHAPLEPHPLAPGGPWWYSEAALAELPNGIGLLLVDGPPGGSPENAGSRHPALSVFENRLAPGALVVLDDAGRVGEREILERWERETGIHFTVRDGGRIAVGCAE